MFKIEDDIIHITRGDKATIEFSIENYTFKEGDIVLFRVYNKNGMNFTPVLKKETIAKEQSEFLNIDLTSEDTKIGKPTNKPMEYWYEIELNGNQTIVGYDEFGAKKLKLYPEGVDASD